jgi:hypothetical protein
MRSDIAHTVSDSDVSKLVEQDQMTSYVSQRAKRPRETCCEDQLIKFKEELKMMIVEMSNSQNISLNKLIKDVTDIKIQNSSIQQSNQEIEKSLQFLSDQFENVSARVENLEKQRKEHLLHISSLEAKVEDIQRSFKSTTVEFRNVPRQSKEETTSDLCSLVQNTCKVLDVEVQLHEIKDIFRVKGKSGSTAIVVDFTRVTKKQEVIRCAKSYNRQHPQNRLNSTQIGIVGNPVPIYVSEGLTSKGRRLLYLARDFTSSAEYKYCWTSNGKVFIRKTDNSPHIEINSEADVMKLKNSQ